MLFSIVVSVVRHVSGVLFAMIVRWQVPGMFQEIFSLW